MTLLNLLIAGLAVLLIFTVLRNRTLRVMFKVVLAVLLFSAVAVYIGLDVGNPFISRIIYESYMLFVSIYDAIARIF